MEPIRIEQRAAFEVFGIERIFKDKKSNTVPKFWQECHNNGSYEKLFQDAGGAIDHSDKEAKCTINAICGYRKTEKHTFPYMICAERKAGVNATGYIIIEIPAKTWAVVKSEEGAEPTSQLNDLFKRVYRWLPTSGYDLAEAPDMEIYYGGGGKMTSVEVWIAVKKK